jgi:hypothetical protein
MRVSGYFSCCVHVHRVDDFGRIARCLDAPESPVAASKRLSRDDFCLVRPLALCVSDAALPEISVPDGVMNIVDFDKHLLLYLCC